MEYIILLLLIGLIISNIFLYKVIYKNVVEKIPNDNKLNITQHIVLEYYDDEIDFYMNVKSNDYYYGDRDQIQNKFIEQKPIMFSLAQYYCKLKGATIEKNQTKILDFINTSEYKYFRLYYVNINLDDIDKKQFEEYRKIGFPVYE